MKEDDTASTDDVSPQYNILSDSLRRCTPSAIQCSVFCGGRRCKYETPEHWDSSHMAIRGIYSHWVTDDILAMARPCTEIITKRNIIRQFQSLGIRSLMNLQEPEEHNNCGCPLEYSGFTYDPGVFMDNGIFYYNYAWKDYGEVKVAWLLDMVKIMCHALSEGKLAVHCHAGLGRTGVLIACFMVYSMRLRANEAIKFVRLKRPNSVQSRGQILCVQAFERYIRPYNVVFSKKLLLKQPKMPEITLPHYILTQKTMLHGHEARCIRYIPKIMYVVCERLLELCGCHPVATTPHNQHAPTTLHFITARHRPLHYHYINNLLNFSSDHQTKGQASDCGSDKEYDIQNSVQPTDKESSPHFEPETYILYNGHEVLEAMLQKLCESLRRAVSKGKNPHQWYNGHDVVEAMLQELSESQRRAVSQYELTLSHGESCWRALRSETRLAVLASLLTDWLELLKDPILHCELLCKIVINPENPLQCLRKFEYVTQYTLEYLFRFVAHLTPLDEEDLTCLLQRLTASLTQQTVEIRGSLVPKDKEFSKLRKGTYRKMMEFSMNLLEKIKENIAENKVTIPKERINNQ